MSVYIIDQESLNFIINTALITGPKFSNAKHLTGPLQVYATHPKRYPEDRPRITFDPAQTEPEGKRCQAQQDSISYSPQMLFNILRYANWRAFKKRYPRADPGPGDIEWQRDDPPQPNDWDVQHLRNVHALKKLKALEYNCSESHSLRESDYMIDLAWKCIDALRARLIETLPGYDSLTGDC